MFLALVLTGLTVTGYAKGFGNRSLTRVSCSIDKGCNTVRFFADRAAKKWPLPGQQEPGIILPVKTNIDNFLSMFARNGVTARRGVWLWGLP